MRSEDFSAHLQRIVVCQERLGGEEAPCRGAVGRGSLPGWGSPASGLHFVWDFPIVTTASSAAQWLDRRYAYVRRIVSFLSDAWLGALGRDLDMDRDFFYANVACCLPVGGAPGVLERCGGEHYLRFLEMTRPRTLVAFGDAARFLHQNFAQWKAFGRFPASPSKRHGFAETLRFPWGRGVLVCGEDAFPLGERTPWVVARRVLELGSPLDVMGNPGWSFADETVWSPAEEEAHERIARQVRPGL